MIKDHKPLPLNKLILLIVVFINVIVLRSGLLDQQNYKYLLLTIPLVFLSVWHNQRNKIYLQSEDKGTGPSGFFNNLFLRKSKTTLHQENIREYEQAASDLHDPAGNHNRSSIASPTTKDKELKVWIGNKSCRQPYHSSIFNIGTISNESIQTVNRVNKILPPEPGNTDHQLINGDLVWKIASVNNLSSITEKSRKRVLTGFASRPEIKMIEIKWAPSEIHNHSNTSPMGYGTTIETSALGLKELYANSASGQVISNTPQEVLDLVKWLREISNGKPVGVAFSVREGSELVALCKGISASGIIPDFITVQENAELRISNESELDFSFFDAIGFVKQTLVSHGLNNKIKIIAEARITNGFDIIKLIANGASACYREQHPANSRSRVKFSKEKYNSANGFHIQSMKTAKEIMVACGLNTIENIQSSCFCSRLKEFEMRNLNRICFLDKGNNLKKGFNTHLN
jgi:hypothetical protein